MCAWSEEEKSSSNSLSMHTYALCPVKTKSNLDFHFISNKNIRTLHECRRRGRADKHHVAISLHASIQTCILYDRLHPHLFKKLLQARSCCFQLLMFNPVSLSSMEKVIGIDEGSKSQSNNNSSGAHLCIVKCIFYPQHPSPSRTISNAANIKNIIE